MKLTLSEIAVITGGEPDGLPALEITGFAPAEKAGEGDIAYISDLAGKIRLDDVTASCVILPLAAKGAPRAYKGGVVYAANPHLAFTLVMRKFAEELSPKHAQGIHPSAVVDASAQIGAGASVGAHCVVEKNARVGEGTVLYPNCFIGENAIVGRNCLFYPGVVLRENCTAGDRVIIHPNSVIGADGFGYIQHEGRHEKIPQLGRVVIENDVEIGALTAIDRATLTETRIGAGTKIDNQVQIAHNVRTGKGCLIVAQAGIAGSSTLGDGVVIAGQVGVVDHVNIGSYSVITAGSGVMHDVPEKSVLFGVPARPHRQAFKILAIINKLPEMYDFFKKLKKQSEAK